MNINGVRASIKANRLEYLLQQLAASFGNAAYTGGDILKLERELLSLRKRTFYVDGQNQVVFLEKAAELPKKTVIRQNDETGATEKFEKEVPSFNAYGFLEDYLGLGVREPFSVAEICATYADLFAYANDDIEWFEKLAEELLSPVGEAVFRGKYTTD